MLRSIALCCALPLVLAACSAEKSPSNANASEVSANDAAAPAATAPTPATAPAPASAETATAAAAPAEDSLGHYTRGDKTLELRDALVLHNDGKEITILLTPTVLSDEERAAVLQKPEFTFATLADKTAPGYPDRYPRVEVTVRWSGPASAANVDSYYVMASGISAANHTDNLNGLPNDDVSFELLEVAGEHVRLKFSGHTETFDEPRDWAFDIDV